MCPRPPPPISRLTHPTSPTPTKVDFAAAELAGTGASASHPAASWALVSQYPPLKLLFGADGTLQQQQTLGADTLQAAGLVPSAQLHVAKA